MAAENDEVSYVVLVDDGHSEVILGSPNRTQAETLFWILTDYVNRGEADSVELKEMHRGKPLEADRTLMVWDKECVDG